MPELFIARARMWETLGNGDTGRAFAARLFNEALALALPAYISWGTAPPDARF